MVVLRATQRVLRLLPAADKDAAPSDTALGDWYVNRIVVQRQPLLLLVSALSLLPVLVPARDVRNLPRQLPKIIAARLERLQIPPVLVEAEVAAMEPAVVAPTRDRSVVGILVDFAFLLGHLASGGWEAREVVEAEAFLQRTPCYASRPGEGIFPDRKAPELLMARWSNDAR